MKRLALYLLFLAPTVCFSQVEKAIQAYKAKDYHTALTEWNQLLANGMRGADLYFNIGNTYTGLKEYPQAILYYRKALKWDPNCAACIKNLKIAEAAAGIETFELPEFILFKIYKSILLSMQAFHWFMLFVLTVSIGIAGYLFKDKIPLSLQSIRLLLLFACISLLLAVHRDSIRNDQNGFVLLQASPLYLSPDPGSSKKDDLKAGLYLQIKDQIQGWIKVQTTELDFGWVELNKGTRVIL